MIWTIKQRWFAIASLVLAMCCGCSDGDAEGVLASAKQSVQKSLDTWKQGDGVETLKSGPTPIEFHDDNWKKSARLVEYEIRNTYMETDGTARCEVGLTVQYGTKSPERLQVTYQVVNKNDSTVIARDPFS